MCVCEACFLTEIGILLERLCPGEDLLKLYKLYNFVLNYGLEMVQCNCHSLFCASYP